MATEFGLNLKALIYQRFNSQRSFIAKAEGESRVEIGQAYLSQVIKGKKPPPLDRLDAWADALSLVGQEREAFLDMATIAHLPEQVRPRFEKILVAHRALSVLAKRLEDMPKATKGPNGIKPEHRPTRE